MYPHCRHCLLAAWRAQTVRAPASRELIARTRPAGAGTQFTTQFTCLLVPKYKY